MNVRLWGALGGRQALVLPGCTCRNNSGRLLAISFFRETLSKEGALEREGRTRDSTGIAVTACMYVRAGHQRLVRRSAHLRAPTSAPDLAPRAGAVASASEKLLLSHSLGLLVLALGSWSG